MAACRSLSPSRLSAPDADNARLKDDVKELLGGLHELGLLLDQMARRLDAATGSDAQAAALLAAMQAKVASLTGKHAKRATTTTSAQRRRHTSPSTSSRPFAARPLTASCNTNACLNSTANSANHVSDAAKLLPPPSLALPDHTDSKPALAPPPVPSAPPPTAPPPAVVAPPPAMTPPPIITTTSSQNALAMNRSAAEVNAPLVGPPPTPLKTIADRKKSAGKKSYRRSINISRLVGSGKKSGSSLHIQSPAAAAAAAATTTTASVTAPSISLPVTSSPTSPAASGVTTLAGMSSSAASTSLGELPSTPKGRHGLFFGRKLTSPSLPVSAPLSPKKREPDSKAPAVSTRPPTQEERELKRTQDKLVQLLCVERPQMPVALGLCIALRSTPDVEGRTVATALTHVLEIGHCSLDFLRSLIDYEVQTSESPETLFRGNTLATRLLTHYALLVSQDEQYLYRVLNALIFTICNSAHWEIDPAHLPPDQSLLENRKNLTAALEMFLSKIMGSTNSFPLQLQRVCVMLASSTNAKYPGHGSLAVGGFVLLRFLCPAILSPVDYGVWKEPLLPHMKRPLLLITRTLMSLSNQQFFTITADRDYLQPVNELIERYMAPMKQCFERLAVPLTDEQAADRAVQLWPRERQANLFDTLSYTVCEHAADIAAIAERHWPATAQLVAAELDKFKKRFLKTDSPATPSSSSSSSSSSSPPVSPSSSSSSLSSPSPPPSPSSASSASSSSLSALSSSPRRLPAMPSDVFETSSIVSSVAAQLLSTPPPSSIGFRVFLADSIVLRSLGLQKTFKTIVLTHESTSLDIRTEVLRKICAAQHDQLQVLTEEFADYQVFVHTANPPTARQLEPNAVVWPIVFDDAVPIDTIIRSGVRLVLRKAARQSTAASSPKPAADAADDSEPVNTDLLDALIAVSLGAE